MDERVHIKLNKISKHYQEGEHAQVILDDINVTINKGDVIALIGPSGSGKTTLLNLISGIDVPDTGELLMCNNAKCIDINAMNEEQKTLFRRHSIGFVFQFFNLIPTLTVLENIQFPLELCDQLDNESNRKISALLKKLSIENKQHHYPEYLSGGEQQRAAIARAIIHQPEILLADEPTGNLDEETGYQVMELLIQLARDYQMTMIIVTHSQEVANRADRILFLKKGCLCG